MNRPEQNGFALETELEKALNEKCYHWLVTGAAGFIGSHLTQTLLSKGQKVTGLDNLEFGTRANLEDIRSLVGEEKWANFRFIKDDVNNIHSHNDQIEDLHFILHHAALASVPASIESPLQYQHTNVTGFLKTLEFAHQQKVKRMTFASSSAIYGENNFELQREDRRGKLLSPYAANKLSNEIDAETWHRVYNLPTVGFRYFNIFGPRQDPNGAYSAVIPKWTQLLLAGKDIEIYGDGQQVRDFCHVHNVVNANIKACLATDENCLGNLFNISGGEPIDLNHLSSQIINTIKSWPQTDAQQERLYKPVRLGDIKFSKADMTKSREVFKYKTLVDLQVGLQNTLAWYFHQSKL